ADLTLTDTLPGGLTLDTSTLKITDGKNPGTTFDENRDYTLTTQTSDPEIAITFKKTKDSNTAYHPTYVVTYQTKVADQYYEDPSTLPTKGFQNSAKLNFTWNDYAGGTATVTHTSPSIGTEVAPNVKLIEKNGLTYDTKTGIIRWQITLNPHKVDVRSATITDVFDQRTDYSLAYIQGSLKCDGNTSDATTHKVSWTEPTGITSLPEITVGEIGIATHVITFETQVLNKAHTGGNGSITYDNTANITAKIMPVGGTTEAPRSDATTAKQEVKSQVLAKKGMGYDYDTHELTWEVTINQNQMAMSGVTVTDQLSQYQSYVDGSATKISGPNPCTITASTTATTGGQTLTLGTWNFAEGAEPLVIQFKTKLDVDQIPAFKDTKGDISFTNQATLHRSDLGYQDVTSNQATIKVVNHPLTKTAASLQDGSIPYTIQINPLGLNLLHTPALTDTLPEGLQLDRDTVILTKAVRQKDGTLQASTNPADQQKWASGCFTYDVKNRVFTIRLAANTSDSYILTYSADIVDSTKSPFQNSVVLSGSSYDNSISGSINSVTVSGGGGGGIVSKRGTITIKKVDKDDTSIALAGAVFRITQQSSGYVITEVTTDQQGQAVVKGLKPNQTYLIQEIQAPKGYPLPNPCPQQTWTPAKAGDQISVTWVNDKQYQPPKPTTPPDTGSTNPSQPGHQTPPVTPPAPTKPMAPIPGTPEFARVYHQVLGESMPARAWSAQVKAEQARKIQAEVLADTALPQTGQNKLLPILLLVCGILFMITGYYGYHKNRRRKHDKNE
ncbi:MAG: SpaA isopeptide-forming pilin-related protein, partial [Clostridium sp.]